jgi:hypothetical protein
MSKLIEHIEQVRRRLTEIAGSELALVRALGDALSRVDEKLLRDVRNVTAEHEARRGAILSELQTLSSLIGTFPAPHEAVPAIGSEAETGGYDGASRYQAALSAGDWRQAAKNIEDDLDFLDWELGRETRAAVNGDRHYSRDIRLDHS